MKKKIFIPLLSLFVLGGLTAGAISVAPHAQKASAIVEGDVEWDYLAFDANNFSVSNGSDPGWWLENRTDSSFWNHRSFNALDNFYNGFKDEGFTGTITSASWKQTKRYVTFTLGGSQFNNVKIFEKGNDTPIKTINNAYFDDPLLSLNMIVRVVDLNDYIGKSLYLQIEDTVTSNFGATTFGALKVSQDEYDVARTLSVHKNHLSRRDTSDQYAEKDILARNLTLQIYGSSGEYSAFDSVVLTDADMDFEDYDQCTNLALDTSSVVGFGDRGNGFDSLRWGFGEAYNRGETWDWNEKMPFNKQGDSFFYGNYGGDGARYTLLTNDFVLSETGYFSIKLGGRGTKAALIDADNGNELISVTNTMWADNGLGDTPIFVSGTRLNTMTRYIVDASEFLGRKVRVAISDTSTEGWSLLFFDELITKYETYPTFNLDVVTQPHATKGNYYGTIPSVLVSNHDDAVKAAHDFLDSYYAVARQSLANSHFCEVISSKAMKDLIDEYKKLDVVTKTIVDGSDDFAHLGAAEDNWFTIKPTIMKMQNNMEYIMEYNGVAPGSQSLHQPDVNNNTFIITIVVSVFVTISLCVLLIIRKKRKAN